MKFNDLLPDGTEAEWTCGHIGGAVCAQCYQQLVRKANELNETAERLGEEIERLKAVFTKEH
jgi:hypothetical protein